MSKRREVHRNKSESEKLNKVKSRKRGKTVTAARYKWIQSSELTRHHQFPFNGISSAKLLEWRRNLRYAKIRNEDYRGRHRAKQFIIQPGLACGKGNEQHRTVARMK